MNMHVRAHSNVREDHTHGEEQYPGLPLDEVGGREVYPDQVEGRVEEYRQPWSQALQQAQSAYGGRGGALRLLLCCRPAYKTKCSVS